MKYNYFWTKIYFVCIVHIEAVCAVYIIIESPKSKISIYEQRRRIDNTQKWMRDLYMACIIQCFASGINKILSLLTVMSWKISVCFASWLGKYGWMDKIFFSNINIIRKICILDDYKRAMYICVIYIY